MKKSIPIVTTEDYLKAFTQFSGCTLKDLEGNFRLNNSEPCIRYNGETYLVSTYNDLLDRYRYFITTPSYSEIYSQTPIALWEHFIGDIDVLANYSSDEIIVSLYNNWCTFWSDRIEGDISVRSKLEKSKDNSCRDIKVLMHTVEIEPINILINASNLHDDITLVPIVVMTIYDLYNRNKIEDNGEQFLSECLKHLIENGHELITDDKTFEKVTSVTKNGLVDFYIYNPFFEFDDAGDVYQYITKI